MLAVAQTEDELANVLAHEIEHVELGQVSARVSELAKQKEIKNLELSEFFLGYTKEQELACDLNGQRLAAKAGYLACRDADAAGDIQSSSQRRAGSAV